MKVYATDLAAAEREWTTTKRLPDENGDYFTRYYVKGKIVTKEEYESREAQEREAKEREAAK